MLNLAVAMGAAGGTPRPSRNAPAEMVPGSPPTLLTTHRPPVPKPAQVLLGINNASQANLSVGVQSLTVRDAMCGPMVPGVYYTYDEGECGAQRCPVGDDDDDDAAAAADDDDDDGPEPPPCPDDDTECVDAAAVNDLPSAPIYGCSELAVEALAKPRVRRPLHELTDDQWDRVVRAFWTLRTVDTLSGQERFGGAYFDYEYFVLRHTTTSTCLAIPPPSHLPPAERLLLCRYSAGPPPAALPMRSRRPHARRTHRATSTASRWASRATRRVSRRSSPSGTACRSSSSRARSSPS